MARTVRNPLELRTPVRTISSVMRNAPRQQFRPNQLDFGDGRQEQGSRGNLTSVARAPRETNLGFSPMSQGVNAPVSRGTNSQLGTSRAPQTSPKQAITSTVKKPLASTKTTATTKAPVAAKTTTTKAPVAAKTTTATKTPIAAKTAVTTKPTTTTTPAKSTNSLTSTLKNAALGAGAGALINKLVNTPKTSVTPKQPVSPTVKPPVSPTSVVKTPVTTSKPSSIASTATKAATGALTAKGATTGTTGKDTELTDEQIQAELDRVKAEEEANVIPEGAVTNADGTYSVTQDGIVTTYGADGSVIGAEAASDNAGLTDLGEGYFADASGNIYNSSGDLQYTLGSDGEYIDANALNAETPIDDATTWSDPDTGFTWNLGADGQWTQEGFDGSGEDTVIIDDTAVDNTVVDDGSNDDELGYLSNDGSEEDNAKGGSIHSKYGAPRFATAGSVTPSAYSDTTEEVQPWQNVDFNYTENANGPITGSQSLYKGNAPYNPTYLSSTQATSSPDGWPDGYEDNYDGTATRIEEDGSTITIDADNNIVYATDPNGDVSQVANTDSAVPNGPTISDNGDGTFSYWDGDQYVTADSETGAEVSRTDSNGQIIGANDSNAPNPVGPITSTGGGDKTGFAALQGQNKGDQPDQSGILDSLLNAVKKNPALAGGAVGALLSSLMNQSDGSSSQPVDISQLTSFNPRTTDFGAGMVGGRTGTGSPLVSYKDYAEDYGNETPDDRLYSDLGISGWLREPDMNNYRDANGNLTDQSGNLVDQYGYLLDDGSGDQAPEDENSIEDTTETAEEPTMASGGTTHYTFGRVMNPAENLGIGMKMGGLSQAHTVHSHQTNPVIDDRVDFRKGSAVNGAGDGQSDDIPAWLADGEYVMDAELVSMLGNGSNKAGAKVLDKFREEVRSHKRSAPLGKIPPKAKSPLNYIKESMNG